MSCALWGMCVSPINSVSYESELSERRLTIEEQTRKVRTTIFFSLEKQELFRPEPKASRM